MKFFDRDNEISELRKIRDGLKSVSPKRYR